MTKILIVDNQKMLCDALQIYFEGRYEFIFTRTGKRALDLLKDPTVGIDIAVLDIELTFGISGLETVIQARKNGVEIPLLIWSARRPLRALVGNLGVSGFVPKPLSLHEFDLAIREVAKAHLLVPSC